MTTNEVFEAAKTFQQAFQTLGKAVSTIDFSTNRNGQFSAYFEVSGHGRIRVSDHLANQDFRIAERTVDFADATPAKAAEIIEGDMAYAKEQAAKRADAMARQDAYEAPFKARFLAARQHERTDIIIEAYPAMRHDKARRREVADRWFGR